MSARPDGAGGDFLGRWSRRKRGAPDAPVTGPAGVDPAPVDPSSVDAAPIDVAVGAAPLDAPPVPVDPADATPPVDAFDAARGLDVPEPSPLTDADMVPLDSLDGSSDVSAFLSRGVSASLRRAALRRVFRAPKFNVRDGLNDYDGDFTAFAPLGDTVTCDMKFRTARLEREAAEREAREAKARDASVDPGDGPSEDAEGTEDGEHERAADPAVPDDDRTVAESDGDEDRNGDVSTGEPVAGTDHADERSSDRDEGARPA